jgi:hypothetical protein
MPEHSQGDFDCSRWSVRIAAEITLQRSLSPIERRTFEEWGCPKSGDSFTASVAQFSNLLPRMMLAFTRVPVVGTRRRTRSTSSSTEEEQLFVTVHQIETALDDGHVLLLNVQNVAFGDGGAIQPATPWDDGSSSSDRVGHCICCVGHDERTLVCQDSNGAPYRKTIAKDALRASAAALEAQQDLTERERLMKCAMYIAEMYVVSHI